MGPNLREYWDKNVRLINGVLMEWRADAREKERGESRKEAWAVFCPLLVLIHASPGLLIRVFRVCALCECLPVMSVGKLRVDHL